MKKTLSLKTNLTLSYGALSILMLIILLVATHILLQVNFRSYVNVQREELSKEALLSIENQLKKSKINEVDYSKIGYPLLNKGLILTVYDKDGNRIYCEDEKDCIDMLSHIKQCTQVGNPYYKGTFTEKEYPLTSGGKTIGSIRFGYSGPYYYTERESSFIRNINISFIFIGFFFLAIAIFLGRLMAEKIVRPINSIGKFTKQVGSGDYSSRLDEKFAPTEIYNLTKDINHMTDELIKQQETQQRMVKDYAHELRTPLTVLHSNLEAFSDGLWEPTTERLSSCLEEIERLTRMVSDMDRLSGFFDGSIKVNKENFNLTDLSDKIIKNFETACKARNIKFTSSLDDEVFINADKDQMSRLITNLIQNAVQYTNNLITITLSQNESEIKLSVTDNGIGIKEKDIPYIFDYMYRVDPSRSSHTGGRGIGLSIVKKITEIHQGKFSVESEYGKGSNFTVWFPKNQVKI